MKVSFNKPIVTNTPVIRHRNYSSQLRTYDGDRIFLTSRYNKKSGNSVFNFLRKLLGIRKKLNPQSFYDGTPTAQGPYVASRESVSLSKQYLQSNYLSENEKIIDGFRDPGRHTLFDDFGNMLVAKREIITVDRKSDSYLSNAIKYVKKNTANMSEQKKVKFIFNLVKDISGDFFDSDEKAKFLAEKGFAKDVLLGAIFKYQCATCRHKALMYKVLGEEAGLKVRMMRGISLDLQGFGSHAWNEVKLENGNRLLVDIQNLKIIPISQNKNLNKYDLASYYTFDNSRVYK